MKKSIHAGGALLAGVPLLFMLIAQTHGNTLPLGSIRFEGNLPLEKAEILEKIDLPPGTLLDPDSVQAGSERLRAACRDAYHPLASIKWKVVPDPDLDAGILVFTVDAGPRGRLRDLQFSGARAFTYEELTSVLKTLPREGAWNRLIRKDRLKLEALKLDRAALVELYHQNGYAAVEVGSSVLEKPSELDGFRLTWPILSEGQVYKIGFISFQARALPKNKILEQLINLEPGEIYDSRKIRSSRQNLQKFLFNKGYGFSSVTVELERKDSEGLVNVDFVVTLGKKPILRDIIISGNERTRDHVILREIPVEKGSVFDGELLEASQVSLSLLPMFSKVEMNYDGDSDSDEYDLKVSVKEKLTGRLEAGVTYGEIEEAAFLVNIFDSNLSLKPPFRGDALKGRLNIALGSSVTMLAAEISNPRVRDSYWSLDGAMLAEDSKYISEEYNQRSLNGQLAASYPIAPGQLVSIGLGATWYALYDVSEVLAEQLDPEQEEVRYTALLTSWALDQTDQLIRPSQGIRLRVGLELGTEVLGGDTDAVRANLKSAFFYNPYRSHVLSLRAEFDAVQAYSATEEVPLPLRTFLGGARNLRGFDYRSVSPVDEEGLLLGGESAWWASLEYMFPVLSKLDLAIYYDLGDVSEDSFSLSGAGPVSNVGVGFLVRADNFPVRFDMAAPIDLVEEDRVNKEGDIHISFSAGYRFY